MVVRAIGLIQAIDLLCLQLKSATCSRVEVLYADLAVGGFIMGVILRSNAPLSSAHGYPFSSCRCHAERATSRKLTFEYTLPVVHIQRICWCIVLGVAFDSSSLAISGSERPSSPESSIPPSPLTELGDVARSFGGDTEGCRVGQAWRGCGAARGWVALGSSPCSVLKGDGNQAL